MLTFKEKQSILCERYSINASEAAEIAKEFYNKRYESKQELILELEYFENLGE